MNKPMAMLKPISWLNLGHQQKQRKRVLDLLAYIILLALTLVIVFPLFWMLVTSFKPLSEVRRWPPTFLPETFTLFNYTDIWQQYPFANFLGNSFFISIMGTIGAWPALPWPGCVFRVRTSSLSLCWRR